MPGILRKFKKSVEAGGLEAAMRWLNDGVPYRYTAIFAFDGEMLRNICLIDKENPKISSCSDQPITESYCMYIHRSHELFTTEQALLDKRVEGHPKRRNIQCYYGIPLFDSDGKMLGTVCHFDHMPVRITEAVAEALDDLAPLIAEAAFGAKQTVDERIDRAA
jgi:GAF domain-containing protein